MTETQITAALESKTPAAGTGVYSTMPAQWQSLTLTDSLGVIFSGILTIILLIGWMRAEARYRKLITHQEIINGSN
jgi:hypothetical protein